MRPVLLKVVVWVVCGAPGVLLLYRAFVTGDLGVNPVETLQHETGAPALQILLATLLVTPLRRLTGWQQLARLRRPLGLWAFFYAVVHFAIYLVFDRFFSIPGIVEDVVLRRFILSGMVALLAMVPLALTSTKGWIRRLGSKRWRKLHRLVYVAAVAGALHFIWKEKVLTVETITYFALVTVLIGFRIVDALRKPAAPAPPSRPAEGSSPARETAALSSVVLALALIPMALPAGASGEAIAAGSLPKATFPDRYAVFTGTPAPTIADTEATATRFAPAQESAAARSPLEAAQALMDAFNEHDPAAMAALVAPDFELYYVDEEGVAALAVRGPEQLIEEMTPYFAARPSVRSTIAASIDGPVYVSFREQIVGGQSSIAVYEVRDGLIQRVWYFPAE